MSCASLFLALACTARGPGGPRSPSSPSAPVASAPDSRATPHRLRKASRDREARLRAALDPASEMYAYTEPGELPQIAVEDGAEPGVLLPLEHTDVDALARGPFARVTVKQRFSNPHTRPIAVTYTFPLPENAAVSEMRMHVGKRIIEAEIRTRDEARSTYEQAKAAGHTAALLEQERPNIFTQSVANIAPGETIEVETVYLQTLTQDAGTHEFVFPMVVGPRFVPPSYGAGDPNHVADAHRITPPILGKGERSGHDLSLRLRVDAGGPVRAWKAPTHTVLGKTNDEGFELRLADAKTLPNRDFVLRWDTAGAQPSAALFLGPKDAQGEGSFAFVVQAPKLDLDAAIGRREMIFVVDRSGSMHGTPLALAKQTMRQTLATLRPTDTFNVIGFASGTSRLFEHPRPANAQNLVVAERFIDGMEAGGGTMLEDAVQAALQPAVPKDRNRNVLFLTDGYVGNEAAILKGVSALLRRERREGGRARVFGVGIGASVNRHLIESLGRAGDGLAGYVTNREHPTELVERMQRVMDKPVLEGLSLDWDALQAEQVFPSKLPDLFAGHPVIVMGRYRGHAPKTMRLHAEGLGEFTPNGGLDIDVAVSQQTEETPWLSTLWARHAIADLETRYWDGDLTPAKLEVQTTLLGLEHHLVTAYTSLVAVDRSRVVGDGRPTEVTQPVEVPEDVDPAMAGSPIFPNTAAPVVVGATATTTSVEMDQAKQIPVAAGGSRDYTAVVDLSPSRGGISLAGTTAATSPYSVHGANMNNPAFGDMAPVVPKETQAEMRRAITVSGGTHWRDEARLSISRLAVPAGVDKRKLRRMLDRASLKFESCYVQRVGEPGRAKLRVQLRFDAEGKMTAIDFVSGSLGSDDADGCVEAVLQTLEWGRAAEAGKTLEFTLGWWMR